VFAPMPHERPRCAATAEKGRFKSRPSPTLKQTAPGPCYEAGRTNPRVPPNVLRSNCRFGPYGRAGLGSGKPADGLAPAERFLNARPSADASAPRATPYSRFEQLSP
jgi:hypothetical protein